MADRNFTWVKTHGEITDYLKTKENSQPELIELLKSIGISPFKDKVKTGDQTIDLDEIDPFTFFCYIYKYGSRKRLYYLQEIAKEINASIPSDEMGIPSAQAQQVWLFPYKYSRVNNEISRLWSFFFKALNNTLVNSDFEDVLTIKCVGKTKITEALFYIDPLRYFPINGPTKQYINKFLDINPRFNTFSEYTKILKDIGRKTDIPFYELSYEARKWTDKKKSILKKSNTYSEQLLEFLDQAKTDNLKTKHFDNEYNGLKVKVSFGQGVSARIPWISFLKEPFSTSEGIYPVYLYYKNINKLVLAYGVSETNRPQIEWNINNPKKIKDFFNDNSLNQPDRYGDSFLFKSYNTNDLPNKDKLDSDLNEIIQQYLSINMAENKTIKVTVDFDISQFHQDCKNSGLKYSTQLITRYISSLATKPFVLLSGLSGSGKTKLAQCFAEWICEEDSQYCIVPVGADWTNREPLLGYVNALDDKQYILPENGALELIIRANNDKENPYFLILDEMNLSHVERYFADFLSVMESKDNFKLHSDQELEKSNVPHELAWPQNFFVVGTVNIDETTYMFSPKVLDRANVIEFRVDETEIESFLIESKEITTIAKMGASMSSSFVEIAKYCTNNNDFSQLNSELLNFFKELQNLGAEFGYRTASEIQTLFSKLDLVNPSYATKENEKIDIAIMQKLLPKLHGSRRKLLDTLNLLANKCLEKDQDIIFDERGVYRIEDKENIKYKLSFEKIARMYKNAIENGFASYAEA
tara:strand:+ start:2050 stop:4314 length:2265 start_codon:yes stop_codon:yes gene_type:complete